MDGKNEINPEEDERVESIFLSKSQVEALIIGLPEMIDGAEHRLKYFSNFEVAIPELMKHQNLTEAKARENCEINIAMATSLIDEYPGIMKELKEVYPMFDKPREEPKKGLILPYELRTKSPGTGQ